MRRAARIDDNHNAIVSALRKAGCSVRSVAAVGVGMPDLLIGYRGRNLLLELKDGSKVPSARKLTSFEQAFFDTWAGQVAVAESVEQALHIVAVMTAVA